MHEWRPKQPGLARKRTMPAVRDRVARALTPNASGLRPYAPGFRPRVSGRFRSKTTRNVHRRNSCPPRVLARSQRTLCHYMSPWIWARRRSNSERNWSLENRWGSLPAGTPIIIAPCLDVCAPACEDGRSNMTAEHNNTKSTANGGRAERPFVLLLGTTAAGKSAVGLELAERLGAEILSVDSMQVYRRMDIGTAKPTEGELSRVRHHLVNVAEPSEAFSVARFVEMADAAIGDMRVRGRAVLAQAGTPLYLMGLMYGMFDGPSANEGFRVALRERAAREGTAALHAELAKVDPAAAERIHANDLKRIERALEVWHHTGRPLSEQQQQWSAETMRYPATVVGIRREKEENSRRINARVREMVEAGLVEEVRRLVAEPAGMSHQARQAVGYAEIIEHLEGRCTLEEAIEQIKIHTRRLAKHQRTWFRKFPTARWIDVGEDEPANAIAERVAEAILQSP